MADPAFMEIARYDWVQLSDRRNKRLHAFVAFDDPKQGEGNWGGPGTTACGRHDEWLSIAGIFSRMEAPRCDACCEALGMPKGEGSPKNDEALRPLVGLL